GEEALDGRSVAPGPRAVEGVADERYRALRPEGFHDVIHGDRACVSLGFEIGAEIPKRQRGIGLALQRLLRQQRQRAVYERGLFLEIEAAAARQRLQQEPALVERAAGNGELPASEIDDLPDRRSCRHHHRAERARRGIKDEVVAERTLARDP